MRISRGHARQIEATLPREETASLLRRPSMAAQLALREPGFQNRYSRIVFGNRTACREWAVGVSLDFHATDRSPAAGPPA